jgi:hypothetical protein
MKVMRLNASRPILSANREEKEAKLKDFIAEDMAERKAAGRNAPAVYTVIARGTDSPILRALDSLASEISENQISLQILLFDAELPVDESVQVAGVTLPASAGTRYLHDARFASAHEQLVLGLDRVWIGDCMRRDPAKRDAFELYHDQDATAAGYAAASFSRLWTKAMSCRRGSSAGIAHLLVAGQTATPGDGRSISRR